MSTREQRRTKRPDRRGAALVVLPLCFPVLALPVSRDGYADVKLLLVVVAVGLAGVAAAPRWSWSRARQRLRGVGWAALAFLAAVMVATLTADSPTLSLFGAPQRHNGALAYLAGVAVLLLVAAALPPARLHDIAGMLALGAAGTVGYWFSQLAGWDPLGLAPGDAFSHRWVFSSTFGNPNFAGAFIAASLPAALYRVVTAVSWKRGAWAVIAAALGVAVVGADSVQALVATAAGTLVLGVAMLRPWSRRAAGIAAAAGALLALLLLLGLLQSGPLARLGTDPTFVARTWDWRAAVSMVRDEPLTGVGLGRFGAYVRAHRPPDEIQQHGWRSFSDAAHSVPLDLAAGGGLPLVTAYLTLVGLVGWRLARALWTASGERLLLLGTFGGVWLAYQAQSMVSIDESQLSLLHFLAAGAVLALAADPAGTAAAPPDPRRAHPRQVVVLAAAGIAALLMARVTAAEFLLGRHDGAFAADRLGHAEQAASAAARLAPWSPAPFAALGETAEWAGDDGEALAAYEEALARDPRDVFVLTAAAGVASRAGRHERAYGLLQRALLVEPQAATVKVLTAEVAARTGRVEYARRLLMAALAFDPGNEDARALLRQLGERPLMTATCEPWGTRASRSCP